MSAAEVSSRIGHMFDAGGFHRILRISLALLAAAARAHADDTVPPDTPVPTLEAPAPAAPGRLERLHDWLYLGLEREIADIDTWFASSGQEPIPVPPSLFRIGFEGAAFYKGEGVSLVGIPDFEGTLHLPNIERRLKLFITSEDVQESPADPTQQTSQVRAGMRFEPVPDLDLEFGVRAKLLPSAFGTLRWSHRFETDFLSVSPFAKAYAESGLGTGMSGGLTLERWSGFWILRSASWANRLRNTSGITATTWSQTVIAGYAPSIIGEQQYGTVAAGRDLACGTVMRLFVSGDSGSRAALYEGSVIHKRPLMGGWLFGYVEPVMRWVRYEDWHPDPGVRLGIDALFWGVAGGSSTVPARCR